MRYRESLAPQAFVSEQFVIAVRMSPIRAYKLALTAGISSSLLSRIINRGCPVHINDSRIIRIGKLVGLKRDELFIHEQETVR